jgi:diadenosine tetraphosphate (Ap4A) HIT family hydrolase
VSVALAREPITKGHSVVLWKEHTTDLHALSTEDHEYLMDTVRVARDTLQQVYGVEKVYLLC